MLDRLLITVTRDELKLLENHSPHSVLTHGAWARQPLPPSCPPITFSSDPGEGKVAGNNTERERGAGRVGNGKSRVLKVLEDSTECRRPKERWKKKKEGGRSGRSQPNWSHHAWHANDERPHGPPHSLTFPHSGSQQTQLGSAHKLKDTHTLYFPLL